MRMGIGLGVGINRSNYAQGIFNAYSARVVADGGVVESGSCVDAVSSLLQSASLLLIPSGYKGGKLYAEIPTNGNGDLTWTRGGDAFRTNASGVLQRVPWNLLQQSETFENSYWIKGSSSISANNTTSPNGTSTADKLVEDNTTSSKFVYTSTTTSQTGTIYTYSIYAKAGERSWAIIGQNVIGTGYFWVDLSNGIFGSTSGTYISRSIESVGNGWYRISITYSSINSSSVGGIYITSGNNVISYTGNGTSGIFIWGAQLVEGTTAQTYLPTTDRLNFPRLSYMYGSCPSALLEPQRTNVETWSDDFSNAAWTKTNCSITANATTSPDGSMNADKIIENSVNGAHFTFNASATLSVAQTLSVYAKADTRTQINLQLGASSVFYDLSNGTIISGTGGSIQSVGNGWYRCANTQTPTNTNALIYMANGGSASYQGNGTSGLFIYGAQLEQGAFQTTYIPTTSATATRVADSFSRSNIYTNGLISAIGGTWFVELRNNVAYTRDATTRLGIGDTTALTTNSIQFGVSSGGSFRLQIVTFVSGSGATIYTTTTDTTKIAIKWNGSTADVFANGTKVVSGTSFTSTNMENLATNGIGVPFFIQKMSLHPEPLTDAKLIELTTL